MIVKFRASNNTRLLLILAFLDYINDLDRDFNGFYTQRKINKIKILDDLNHLFDDFLSK